MKIIVFGASGDVGRRVVAEGLDRGHRVTAVIRDVAKRDRLPENARVAVADVADRGPLVDLVAEHDLVISAVRPPDGNEPELSVLTKSVMDAAGSAGKRILVVGGAATLKMPSGNGNTVLTEPGFLPQSVVPIAEACAHQMDMVMSTGYGQWSYLSPPAMLMPGERTGQYRSGSDTLLVDVDGNSAISMEDFAVALIDEAEVPRHDMSRFTVAY